ncbi:MAG: hypothetical protein LIP04_11180 [Tannerellaceae bacterium]|nr:hypothetical protein [Tannerellaceae bacterium]
MNGTLKQQIDTFKHLLQATIANFIGQQETVPGPISIHETESFHLGHALTGQETLVLMLALMPHTDPRALDLFFIQNKDLDRPYTEFGGWKGNTHNGFLPTGETAVFYCPEGIRTTPESGRKSYEC